MSYEYIFVLSFRLRIYEEPMIRGYWGWKWTWGRDNKWILQVQPSVIPALVNIRLVDRLEEWSSLAGTWEGCYSHAR